MASTSLSRSFEATSATCSRFSGAWTRPSDQGTLVDLERQRAHGT